MRLCLLLLFSTLGVMAAPACGGQAQSEGSPSPGLSEEQGSSSRDAIGNPLPADLSQPNAVESPTSEELRELLDRPLTSGAPLFFPSGVDIHPPVIAPYGDNLIAAGRTFFSQELGLGSRSDEDQFFVLRVDEALRTVAFSTHELPIPREIAVAPDGSVAVAIHVWENFEVQGVEYLKDAEFFRPVIALFDPALNLVRAFQTPDLRSDSYPAQLLFDRVGALYAIVEVDNSDDQAGPSRWIGKYERDGTLIWSRTLETEGRSWQSDAAVLPDGDLAMVGSFSERLMLDESTFEKTEGAGEDGFLVELSSTTGEVLQAVHLASDQTSGARVLTVTSSGEVRVAGTLRGAMSLQGETVETTAAAAYLLEFSPDFALQSAWLSDEFNSITSMDTGFDDVTYFHSYVGAEVSLSGPQMELRGLRGVYSDGRVETRDYYVTDGSLIDSRVASDGALWAVSTFDRTSASINGTDYPHPSPELVTERGGFALFRLRPHGEE